MDCFITKLKADLDNELLPDVGYAVMAEFEGENVSITQYAECQLYCDNYPLKLVGDGYFFDDNNVNKGKSFMWNSSSKAYGIHVNSGKVILESKYGDQRVYCSLFKASATNHIDIDSCLKATNGSNISTIRFAAKYLTGNIENPKIWKLGNYITLFSTNPSNVTGNIENIVRTSSAGFGNLKIKNHPLITGRLEKLFEAIATTVASSSNRSVVIEACPNVTWNGQNIVGTLSGTVSFDGNGGYTTSLTYYF